MYIAIGEPYLSIIAFITFRVCDTALSTTGFKIASSNSETGSSLYCGVLPFPLNSYPAFAHALSYT